jgi:hypothetical protein
VVVKVVTTQAAAKQAGVKVVTTQAAAKQMVAKVAAKVVVT